MPVKSIVAIDINDTKFREFQRLYEKYDKALKSAPAAWKLVQQNIDGSRASFDKMVEGMAAATVQAKLREKAQERADVLTRTAAQRWQALARSSREFATNIAGATTSLLKWASLTGIISGLVGAGGLFGIDRLALGIAGTRRSALGLGLGVGELQAFGPAFSRLVDPEAFLQGVAGAKFDVTRRVGLLGAGLTPSEIAADTGTTAVALLRRLKQIADATNPALFAQVIQARRLDQFVSPTDLERLRNTSPAEFERLLRTYGSRSQQFALPPGVAERWQDFVTQMSNAGRTIETVLVKGLVNLAPGLGKLSDAVAKTFATLLEKGGPVEKWVDKLGVALSRFADYVGTDDFQKKVERFVTTIGAAVDWIDKHLPALKTTAAVGNAAVGVAEGLYGAGRVGAALVKKGYQIEGKILSPFIPHFGGGGGTITADQLLALEQQREGSGPYAVSPKGAIGRNQILPGTAAQYGFDSSRLFDQGYNDQVARAILADLIRRYHGNVSEILAAYNAGPGRADKYRAASDNPAVLPAETQKYIGGTSGMRVQVDNNTGGSAIVSVNGLKQ